MRVKESRTGVQAEAERALLGAALEEPANQRFMLASEACAPLYPPAVLYAEALAHGGTHRHALAHFM